MERNFKNINDIEIYIHDTLDVVFNNIKDDTYDCEHILNYFYNSNNVNIDELIENILIIISNRKNIDRFIKKIINKLGGEYSVLYEVYHTSVLRIEFMKYEDEKCIIKWRRHLFKLYIENVLLDSCCMYDRLKNNFISFKKLTYCRAVKRIEECDDLTLFEPQLMKLILSYIDIKIEAMGYDL